MILIQINRDQLDALNNNDKVLIKCNDCGNDFFVKKNKIVKAEQLDNAIFCSKFCKFNYFISETASKYKEILLQSIPLFFHNNKMKRKIKKQKLHRFIVGELKKRLPNLIITQKEDEFLDINFDIYIPSLKIGFIIRKIYNNNLEIKHDIFNKINICKQNNINLYVLDINEFEVFNRKLGINYTNEIYNKIIKEIKNNLNEKTIN